MTRCLAAIDQAKEGWCIVRRAGRGLATIDQAKKEVYFHGLAKVKRIVQSTCSAVSPAGGSSEQLVRQTLMLMDGFCWLDEPAGWFRLLGIEKHGLPKAIDKVLAVAGAVTAAQLRAALGAIAACGKSCRRKGCC